MPYLWSEHEGRSGKPHDHACAPGRKQVMDGLAKVAKPEPEKQSMSPIIYKHDRRQYRFGAIFIAVLFALCLAVFLLQVVADLF